MKELSPQMLKAIAYAKSHGGTLYRHPGGFWTGSAVYSLAGDYFGTTTVEALVSREAAEYTEWQEGRAGRFPTRVAIKEAA